MEETTISLVPILDVVIQLFGAALMAVGTWAVTMLSQKLKLSSDSEVRTYLQEALQRAVNFGVEKARSQAKDIGTVDVRNEVVADAANYVIGKTPDALKKLGISDDSVQDLVRARLPAVT